MLRAWKFSSSVSTSGLSTTDEPELAEDARDLALGLAAAGGAMPRQRGAARQRDVLGLGREARSRSRCPRARSRRSSMRGLDALRGRGWRAHRRGVAPRPGARRCRPSSVAQLALAAEDGGVDRLERVRRIGRRDGRDGARSCELLEPRAEGRDVHARRRAHVATGPWRPRRCARTWPHRGRRCRPGSCGRASRRPS